MMISGQSYIFDPQKRIILFGDVCPYPPPPSTPPPHTRGLFFGDYLIPGADPRVYDEVTDFKELTSIMER